MSGAPLENVAGNGVCCPTCNAKQSWSDTCRRCKCDLALLKGVAEARRGARRRCLIHLRAGRVSEALREARRGYALCPDRHSARLLAVCLLCCGEFGKAVRLARTAEEKSLARADCVSYNGK